MRLFFWAGSARARVAIPFPFSPSPLSKARLVRSTVGIQTGWICYLPTFKSVHTVLMHSKARVLGLHCAVILGRLQMNDLPFARCRVSGAQFHVQRFLFECVQSSDLHEFSRAARARYVLKM